jgi:hypothetical protein
MAKFGELKFKTFELEYIDNRPVYIPKLAFYRKGLKPKKGQVIKVIENEKKKLLNQKNGKNPVWKEIKTNRRRSEEVKTEE